MSGEKWQQTKSRYDPLNLKKGTYKADEYDYYQIPLIQKEPHQILRLTPFNKKIYNSYCHFFLDDYQFERIWNQPKKYLNILKQYKGVLTPDFSLYTDYPLAVQIWNTYRNRWLGAYWQEQGIKVIPTISWSTPESYDFCFEGIPTESTIAISSVGILNDKTAIKYFKQGYKAMIDIIEPKHIIFYGDWIEELNQHNINFTFFDSFSVQSFGRYTKKQGQI